MSDLYIRLRTSLLEQHKNELEELAKKFGAGKSIVFIDEQCDLPVKSVKRYKRKRQRGLRINIVAPTVREMIQAEFVGREFTTREALQAMHKFNREMWSRLRKSKSIGAALEVMCKRGIVEKRTDDDGLNQWKVKVSNV